MQFNLMPNYVYNNTLSGESESVLDFDAEFRARRMAKKNKKNCRECAVG